MFRAFTGTPTAATLVMCHPGLVDDALVAADCLTDQREVESTPAPRMQCARFIQQRGIGFARLMA